MPPVSPDSQKLRLLRQQDPEVFRKVFDDSYRLVWEINGHFNTKGPRYSPAMAAACVRVVESDLTQLGIHHEPYPKFGYMESQIRKHPFAQYVCLFKDNKLSEEDGLTLFDGAARLMRDRDENGAPYLIRKVFQQSWAPAAIQQHPWLFTAVKDPSHGDDARRLIPTSNQSDGGDLHVARILAAMDAAGIPEIHIPNKDFSAFLNACLKGNEAHVRGFVAHYGAERLNTDVNPNGLAALHCAASAMDPEEAADRIRLLVSLGADPLLKDRNGYVPLILACSNGSIEPVKALFDVAKHPVDVLTRAQDITQSGRIRVLLSACIAQATIDAPIEQSGSLKPL